MHSARTHTSKRTRHNHGLTLIELSIVIGIMSLGMLGLVSSAITLVGFYQDDLVLKDVRRYGSTVLEEIANKMEEAYFIQDATGPSGYDMIRLKYPGDQQTYTLQATETEGMLWQGQPLLPYMPLQVQGEYRNNGQREIALVDFWVDNLHDSGYEPLLNRPNLTPLKKSVYELWIIYGITTRYSDGGEQTEYVTFRKKVYAAQKLIYIM